MLTLVADTPSPEYSPSTPRISTPLLMLLGMIFACSVGSIPTLPSPLCAPAGMVYAPAFSLITPLTVPLFGIVPVTLFLFT